MYPVVEENATKPNVSAYGKKMSCTKRKGCCADSRSEDKKNPGRQEKKRQPLPLYDYLPSECKVGRGCLEN